MEYTQENIERIKPLFPNNFIKEVVSEWNKGREEHERDSYSTIYDCFTRCRTGVQKKQRGKETYFDKKKCFRLAVKMLKEKGILN